MKKLCISMLFMLCLMGTHADAQSDKLAAAFPEIKNLPKYGDPMVFSPDTLYEYINGAAEIYLQYNFQELVAQEYENDAGAFMTIEIYRHDSTLNAFGIYSQERPFEGEFLNIGAQGFYENGMLNFFKGPYYVKLNSYGLGEQEEATLIALAKEFAEQLDGTTELPEELTYFPPTGKKPYSEQYLAQDFLGYEFLKSAFTTSYTHKQQTFQMFLIVGDSPEMCATMLKEYAIEVGMDPVTIIEGSLVFDDAYHGPVEMRWQGRYVWGLKGVDAPETRQELLNRMEARLPKTK
jgi:hypothetical protein